MDRVNFVRAQRELQQFGKGTGMICLDATREDDVFCILRPFDDSLLAWHIAICGPKGTPYADGIFELSMELKSDWMKAPKMRFITPIYHPNVNIETGDINLNILRYDYSPALLVRHFAMSAAALLSVPTFDLACWKNVACKKKMCEQIRLGQTDLSAWEVNARAHAKPFVLPTVSSAFLLWVAKQTPLPEDVWIKYIIPRTLRARAHALAGAVGLSDEEFDRNWRIIRAQ